MRKLLPFNFILLLAFLFLPNPGYAQIWQKVEGTKAYVNKIYFPNGNPQTIAVCSDEIPTDLDEYNPTFYPTTGSGYQISTNEGASFESKLAGLFVFDITAAKANSDKWIAAIRQASLGGIILSEDKGANWNTDNVRCESSSQIWKIVPHPSQENVYYTASFNTSQGFSETTDGFETCKTNSGFKISSRDMAISKANPSLMFIAGDKTNFGGVYRSYDGGKTWLKDSSGLENLRIHCVLPAPANANVVYCGADSLDANRKSHGKGLFMSIDTGKTWTSIGAKGENIYALAAHPSNSESFAAAGGKSGVWVCGKIGKYFEQFSSGLPDNASVRTVAIPDIPVDGEGFIVYAGTFGDGMFKSRRITSSVETAYDSKAKIVEIYPQPASNYINISYSLAEESHMKVTLRNTIGKTVYSRDFGHANSGNGIVRVDLPNDVPSGIYFVELSAGNYSFVSKVIVSK